ncbi:hypothetical protein E2C01_013650 [Portunus trituberculatus]|uniref:Uncharacterized protein n=1 Tax=Portunus trituberculatus TaxID=210409 RepID=A0A5B7DHX7_PORTR|nr:hypothetical protein [Portunus trituberculatus]
MRRLNGGWPRLGVSGVFLASRQADLHCGLPVCYLPCLPEPYLSTWPSASKTYLRLEGRKGRSCVQVVGTPGRLFAIKWLVAIALVSLHT